MLAKTPYLKNKLKLYFDENFPSEVIEAFKNQKRWQRKCKIFSVRDLGNERRDDYFQFEFCKQKGFVLVTLDDGYMDDNRYPFMTILGLIVVKAKKNEAIRIYSHLIQVIDFLSSFPFPKLFVGDSKFQVSESGCIMRARDAVIRNIKTMHIKPGDTWVEVAKFFSY